MRSEGDKCESIVQLRCLEWVTKQMSCCVIHSCRFQLRQRYFIIYYIQQMDKHIDAFASFFFSFFFFICDFLGFDPPPPIWFGFKHAS